MEYHLDGLDRSIDTNTFIHSFTECSEILAEPLWRDHENSLSFKTGLTIKNLAEQLNREKRLKTCPREYQREKVSSLKWKQEFLETIVANTVAKVPELHFRSIHNGTKSDWEIYKHFLIEVLDGQQRITTILDYMEDKFPLGKLDAVLGYVISGKRFSELPYQVRELFESYKLYATIYVNISGTEASHLFINILNNMNEMNAQEKRNAMNGPLAKWVRDTARFEDTRHELFERDADIRKGHEGEYLMRYFNQGFGVGRMQSDEWLAQFFYLTLKGWTAGVTQGALTKWYLTTNSESGVYQSESSSEWQKDKKMMTKLLDESLRLIKSVSSLNKKRLSNMVTLVLCLYYQELKRKYGKVEMGKFTDKFFEVYDDWSCEKKKLYKGHLQVKSDSPKKKNQQNTELGQFNKLFGGKGDQAMKSIRYVLNLNVDDNNLSEWGIIRLDSKRAFTEDQKYLQWKKQGGKCYFTGQEIELRDAVADHDIPHAWGIDKGGVTSEENLIVTNQYHNSKKSDKYTAEEYKEQLSIV